MVRRDFGGNFASKASSLSKLKLQCRYICCIYQHLKMYLVSLRNPSFISSVLKMISWRNWISLWFWLSCEVSAHVLASVPWMCCSSCWLRRCDVKIAIPIWSLQMKWVNCWKIIQNDFHIWSLTKGKLLSQNKFNSGWLIIMGEQAVSDSAAGDCFQEMRRKQQALVVIIIKNQTSAWAVSPFVLSPQ